MATASSDRLRVGSLGGDGADEAYERLVSLGRRSSGGASAASRRSGRRLRGAWDAGPWPLRAASEVGLDVTAPTLAPVLLVVIVHGRRATRWVVARPAGLLHRPRTTTSGSSSVTSLRLPAVSVAASGIPTGRSAGGNGAGSGAVNGDARSCRQRLKARRGLVALTCAGSRAVDPFAPSAQPHACSRVYEGSRGSRSAMRSTLFARSRPAGSEN